jgi:hypothetical protein
MATVSNKTHRPLSVPLPRGKKLHLGPGKTGQIAANALEHPPLKKLVEAGEVEIVDESQARGDGPGDAKGRGGPTQGHSSGGVIRRSGDR